jgi:hypothetical protein
MQSAQQFGATLFMFGNLDSCFAPLLAIQLAAFLMTLVRKNMIDSNTWHRVYNVSLWINVFCFWSLPFSYVLAQPVLFHGMYVWRLLWKQDKYIGWTIAYALLTYGLSIAELKLPINEHIIRNTIIAAYLFAQKEHF